MYGYLPITEKYRTSAMVIGAGYALVVRSKAIHSLLKWFLLLSYLFYHVVSMHFRIVVIWGLGLLDIIGSGVIRFHHWGSGRECEK